MCARLCAQSPALVQLAHQENSFLPSLWPEEDTVLLCAALRTSAVGKGRRLEGVQVKSGGWHTWHCKAGWGHWACLGCPRDLIALFHSGDYTGDRATLSLKMTRERTSCNFLQGKLWPHSRERIFTARGVRQWKRLEEWWDLCASDTWNKALRELIFEVNLVLSSWEGPLEVIHCHELLK